MVATTQDPALEAQRMQLEQMYARQSGAGYQRADAEVDQLRRDQKMLSENNLVKGAAMATGAVTAGVAAQKIGNWVGARDAAGIANRAGRMIEEQAKSGKINVGKITEQAGKAFGKDSKIASVVTDTASGLSDKNIFPEGTKQLFNTMDKAGQSFTKNFAKGNDVVNAAKDTAIGGNKAQWVASKAGTVGRFLSGSKGGKLLVGATAIAGAVAAHQVYKNIRADKQERLEDVEQRLEQATINRDTWAARVAGGGNVREDGQSHAEFIEQQRNAAMNPELGVG